jgi:hypothetical protein
MTSIHDYYRKPVPADAPDEDVAKDEDSVLVEYAPAMYWGNPPMNLRGISKRRRRRLFGKLKR